MSIMSLSCTSLASFWILDFFFFLGLYVPVPRDQGRESRSSTSKTNNYGPHELMIIFFPSLLGLTPGGFWVFGNFVIGF